MKRLVSLVLSLMLLLSAVALAEDLQMSDVAGMTADGVLPIVTEPTQLTIAIPQHTLVLDYDDNYMTKMCEEETGLDLVFHLLPSAETATTVDLMMASGDKLPDVFLYDFGVRAAGYGTEGYFVPLNDYYDKEKGYASTFWSASGMKESDYEEYFLRSTEADGNIYGYSFYTKGSGDVPRISPYVNMYWLEKLGMEMPTNMDEFYEMLVRFKNEDPNGNGKPDEIPMIGGTWNGGDDEMLINMFTYWNPDYMLNVKDNKVYAPFVTDEWQEAMKFLNKLVKEGLLSDMTFSLTTEELVSMTQSYSAEEQIIGVLVGMYVTSMPDPSRDAVLAYDVIPPFEGAYTPQRTANVTKLGYITTDCATPEIAFRFFDYWADERRSLITRYGEPGVHWMYRADDPDAFDAYFVGGASQRAEMMGWEPKFGILPVENPWSAQNNAIWNIHMCCMLPEETYGSNATTTTQRVYSWKEGVQLGSVTAYRDYIAAQHQLWRGQMPEQVFVDPIYTVDEMDANNDVITQIRSYVNECIASFATGQMDPEKDWESYKANLESAGIQQWLDLAQIYWDRSHT